MQELRQSTTRNVKIGPFLDKTDAVTEETGLAGAMDVELSKESGAFANRNSATAITHDVTGWYAVELDTTDTDTLGLLELKVHLAGTHLPVWRTYEVVTQNYWDSKMGSDVRQVDVIEASATQGEPGQSNPGANISFIDKISFMFKGWRNKNTNDGTDVKLFNDAGTVVDQKAPVSEAASVVTRGEWISGP